MSTDPTAEHIDAIHTLMDDANPRARARAVLTSTDPAVHAALAASLPAEVKAASLTDAEMLAALVDRGTLTEEPWRVKCLCGKTLEGSPDEVSAWTRAHDDSPKASHIVVWDPPSGKPWTRRHVTQGEVAP